MPQDFARPDSQIFRAYYVQQRRKKRKGSGVPVNPDPVPDFLFNYRLDNNDTNITPVNSPALIAAPELPDITGWSLNGIDQHGAADADSSLFALGTGAYSITGWLNSSELSLRNIISTGSGADDGSLTIRTTISGKLQIRSFNQNRTSTAVVADGTNTFFCISCDGSGLPVRIYINGVIDSTQTASSYNLTDQGVLVIGARGDNTSGRWAGMLDGVRLYDRAITEPECTALFGYAGYVDPVPGFIIKYTMDGNDSSLVPINTPVIVAGLDLPDLLASEFNGVDQYYTANADSALMAIGASPFTIVFRIKISIASARTVMEFGDADAPSGFKVNVRGVGGLTLKINATTLNLSDTRFLDDIWLHVAITGTGSLGTLTFFIDAVANATTRSLPVYNLTDANDFQIGETGLPSILDEMRVYDFVLSQGQITALYNNT